MLHRVHHLEDPSWFTHQLKRRMIVIQYIHNGLQSERIKELVQMKNAYDVPNTLLNMLAAKTMKQLYCLNKLLSMLYKNN